MRYLLMLILLSSCRGEDKVLSTTTTSTAYVVDKLFTHEGYTVYHFQGEWKSGYYTTCDSTTWKVNCGKGCTKDVTNPTNKEK